MPSPNEASKPVTMTYVNGKWRLDWDAVENLASRVKVQMQQALYQHSVVLCIGRGGMVPARLLASKSRVYYIGAETCHGDVNVYQDIITQNLASLDHFGEDLLVIDEICDTGGTLAWAKEKWPKAKFAALMTKRDPEEVGLDFYGIHFCAERWIVFPWE